MCEYVYILNAALTNVKITHDSLGIFDAHSPSSRPIYTGFNPPKQTKSLLAISSSNCSNEMGYDLRINIEDFGLINELFQKVSQFGAASAHGCAAAVLRHLRR